MVGCSNLGYVHLALSQKDKVKGMPSPFKAALKPGTGTKPCTALMRSVSAAKEAGEKTWKEEHASGENLDWYTSLPQEIAYKFLLKLRVYL